MADATCSADNIGFPWPSSWGTLGVLKIIVDREFVSGGKPYPAGRVSDPINQNFCYQSAITVVSNVATFAAITLPQTDALDVQVVNGSGTPLYTAIIYSNGGNTKQRNLFSSWHLSSSLGTSFNFAAWATDNNAPTAINPRSQWVDTDTLNRALAAIAYAPATTTQLGITKLSYTPIDTASPIALSASDPFVVQRNGSGDVYTTSLTTTGFLLRHDGALIAQTGLSTAPDGSSRTGVKWAYYIGNTGVAAAFLAGAPTQLATAEAGLNAYLWASDGVVGSVTPGSAVGGNVYINAGDAKGTSADGGTIFLQPGGGVGSGMRGSVHITSGKMFITNADVTVDRAMDINISGARTATVYSDLISNSCTSSTAGINKYGLFLDTAGTWDGPGSHVYGLYQETVASINYFGGNVGIGSGATVPTSALQVGGTIATTNLQATTSVLISNAGKFGIAPKTNDTYSASMTINVDISNHVIAASFTTSATVTMSPSAVGAAGDILKITTETDASGTVTTTFGGSFHSSGTQVTAASRFSTIQFSSDGTRWTEDFRTTNLA